MLEKEFSSLDTLSYLTRRKESVSVLIFCYGVFHQPYEQIPFSIAEHRTRNKQTQTKDTATELFSFRIYEISPRLLLQNISFRSMGVLNSLGNSLWLLVLHVLRRNNYFICFYQRLMRSPHTKNDASQ